MQTKIVIKNIIIIITTIYYALKKFQILNIDIKSIIKLAVIINIIDSNEKSYNYNYCNNLFRSNKRHNKKTY
jgi:hypothetical protein